MLGSVLSCRSAVECVIRGIGTRFWIWIAAEQQPEIPPFVPMGRINKTEASWSAQSRLGMERFKDGLMMKH